MQSLVRTTAITVNIRTAEKGWIKRLVACSSINEGLGIVMRNRRWIVGNDTILNLEVEREHAVRRPLCDMAFLVAANNVTLDNVLVQ